MSQPVCRFCGQRRMPYPTDKERPVMSNCDHVDHKGAAPVEAVASAAITFGDGAQTVRELCAHHALELRTLWARGTNALGSIADVRI